jgi:hypothetical protein
VAGNNEIMMFAAQDFGGQNMVGSKTPTENGTKLLLKKRNVLARMLVKK